MISTIFFYSLAAIAVVSALLTVTLKNMFRAVSAFALMLLSISGLFLLLNAPFVAFMQVLIYVGAVVILTIFAVMLIPDLGDLPLDHKKSPSFIPVILLIFFFAIIISPLLNQFPKSSPGTTLIANELPKIAELFFEQYLFPFEITSVLLLSALIGATILAKKD